MFDLWLVKSADMKPKDTEGRQYIYIENNSCLSEPTQFKFVLFKGQLYMKSIKNNIADIC